MFVITIIIFVIVIIWFLNKQYGPRYTTEIYSLIKEFIDTSFKEKNLANMALIVLWTMSGITLVLVLYTLGLTPNPKQASMNPLQLMGAFAILLSALMASVSVLLNIKKTRELKILELRKSIFGDIASFITHISLSGEKPSISEITDFAKNTRTAKYFFDDEIDVYINEIINKASSVSFVEDNHYQWFQDQRVSQMDEKFERFFAE